MKWLLFVSLLNISLFVTAEKASNSSNTTKSNKAKNNSYTTDEIVDLTGQCNITENFFACTDTEGKNSFKGSQEAVDFTLPSGDQDIELTLHSNDNQTNNNPDSDTADSLSGKQLAKYDKAHLTWIPIKGNLADELAKLPSREQKGYNSHLLFRHNNFGPTLAILFYNTISADNFKKKSRNKNEGDVISTYTL